MKLKSGFMTRKIGDKIVAVAVGPRTNDFNGMINLNSTGEFIWKCLETDTTLDEVAQKMVDEYAITMEKAKDSASKFIAILKENNFLED